MRKVVPNVVFGLGCTTLHTTLFTYCERNGIAHTHNIYIAAVNKSSVKSSMADLRQKSSV